MHRKTASTVDGASYSFRCVCRGRPCRYSRACIDDDADIVVDVGWIVTMLSYYHIRTMCYLTGGLGRVD
jgi:hypothetical protein